MSALLLLGCFLIVRLAVMMFPAFATLGAFPASRGLVIGLGRTVGAALVNAIIFGIGAGVTIAVLGILFHPGGGAPGWLGIVLMPLFSVIMWVALRPFRRLTTMVSADGDHFKGMSGGLGATARAGGDLAKRLALAGITGATGGAAAGAVAGAAMDDDDPAAGPGGGPTHTAVAQRRAGSPAPRRRGAAAGARSCTSAVARPRTEPPRWPDPWHPDRRAGAGGARAEPGLRPDPVVRRRASAAHRARVVRRRGRLHDLPPHGRRRGVAGLRAGGNRL